MKRLIASVLPPAMRGRFRRLHPDHAIAARAFDAVFYRQTYPDVAAAGLDPLDHFMAHGWREGRDPSPEFSVSGYLDAFPDVAATGVNPLVHYLTNGRPTAARPEPAEGFRYEVLARLEPLDTRLAVGTVATRSESDLAAVLGRTRSGFKGLHVTFSHDDYVANVGGLQFAIGREAARQAELGRDHLHLHPARPWPTVRTADDEEALGVVWNGEPAGAFTPAAIARVLAQVVGGQGEGRTFAIHSLLGHAADETADILGALGMSRGTFWLHDFASLCAGFHLLRNDVADCAAPPPESAACGVCVYGSWRARHLDAHARLFQRLDLTVAAPSQITLDLWRQASALPAVETVVLPHAVLRPRTPTPVARADRPLRVAYAGLPVAHKGWPIFRSLALRFAGDPRYAFHHLGARGDAALPVTFQSVSAGPKAPNAMRDALAAAEIDVVLIWPLCRETFSFVAYEAVAAGCAVITGPDSGNVQAFVSQGGHGQVLDEAALRDAFETGAVRALSRAQRTPMLYDLDYSALTLDLTPMASA